MAAEVWYVAKLGGRRWPQKRFAVLKWDDDAVDYQFLRNEDGTATYYRTARAAQRDADHANYVDQLHERLDVAGHGLAPVWPGRFELRTRPDGITLAHLDRQQLGCG